MKNFLLFNNRVEIVKNNGNIYTIYFNEMGGSVDSGFGGSVHPK